MGLDCYHCDSAVHCTLCNVHFTMCTVLMCIVMQCSKVLLCALLVKCGRVNLMECSALLYCTVQCSGVLHGTLQCIAIIRRAVLNCTVQC